MKKFAFEIVILLFFVGYIIAVETSIYAYPDSKVPLITGIVVSALYTIIVLFSPRRIKLARLWAALSILALIYWIWLLVGMMPK